MKRGVGRWRLGKDWVSPLHIWTGDGVLARFFFPYIFPGTVSVGSFWIILTPAAFSEQCDPHLCCSVSVLPLITLSECPLKLIFRIFQFSLLHLLCSLPIKSFLQAPTILLLLVWPFGFAHLWCPFTVWSDWNIRILNSVPALLLTFMELTFGEEGFISLCGIFPYPGGSANFLPYPGREIRPFRTHAISFCKRIKLP